MLKDFILEMLYMPIIFTVVIGCCFGVVSFLTWDLFALSIFIKHVPVVYRTCVVCSVIICAMERTGS